MGINTTRIKDVEDVAAGVAAANAAVELADTPQVNGIESAHVARVEEVVMSAPTFELRRYSDGTIRRDNRRAESGRGCE
jgi:hypothetical protein